jgi:hypothetical protein
VLLGKVMASSHMFHLPFHCSIVLREMWCFFEIVRLLL